MFRDKDWQKRCKQEQELISPNLGACLLAESGIAYASERSFHASLSLSLYPADRASERGRPNLPLSFPLSFLPPFLVAEPQIVIRLGSPSLPPSRPPLALPTVARQALRWEVSAWMDPGEGPRYCES